MLTSVCSIWPRRGSDAFLVAGRPGKIAVLGARERTERRWVLGPFLGPRQDVLGDFLTQPETETRQVTLGCRTGKTSEKPAFEVFGINELKAVGLGPTRIKSRCSTDELRPEAAFWRLHFNH